MATKIMADSEFTAPRSLGRHLIFAASAASSVANRLLEPHGLSLAQWAILSSLWRNGEMSVKDLASLTGNASPATSRIIDRMIAAKLVVRRQDETDRRAVTVGLSERGEELRHLHNIYERVNEVLLSDLSEADAKTLFLLLSKVENTGRDWLA